MTTMSDPSDGRFKTARRAILCLLPALAGCVTAPRPERASPGFAFSPQAFFVGHTEGQGVFRKIFDRPRAVRVHGTGTIAADGSLTLEQIVEAAGKPVKHRAWHMIETAPAHFAGTLSDAVGPIAGDAAGNTLHIGFRIKGGYRVQQWLRLAPDGRSAHNIMKVRKAGMLVATLDETIRKTD